MSEILCFPDMCSWNCSFSIIRLNERKNVKIFCKMEFETEFYNLGPSGDRQARVLMIADDVTLYLCFLDLKVNQFPPFSF